MRYAYYANDFQFDSHLADFHFFSVLIFRFTCYLYRLGLW